MAAPCEDRNTARRDEVIGLFQRSDQASVELAAQAVFRARKEMKSGIVCVNASTIGAEVHLPFGATKATGNGHPEAGHAALDRFSEWKTLYVDDSGRLQRAPRDV